jgi:tetratricopeptide (TPR) repeat protein
MADEHRSGCGLQVAEPCPEKVQDEDMGTGSLVASLARLHAALARERSEAPALAAELLSVPEDAREERLRGEPRFQTWGICELLLAGAESEDDPAEAGHLARLTLAGAGLLDPARHAAPVVEDLKARTWAARGEARRRRGDLPGAEEALREAASCLSQGTGDLLVEARLLEFEAALRRDQGRTGEAAGLFKQAASRYRQIGDAPRHDRALAQREATLRKEAPGHSSRSLI